MKQILLALSLFLSVTSFAQSFATFDGSIVNTKTNPKAFEIDFTGGAFLKNKELNNRSFTIGAGIGIMVLKDNKNDDRDFYVPLFAQIGYLNSNKKISPYINARVGYGIYKGTGSFFGEDQYTKGGLYSNIRGGASFAVTNKFSLVPFVGYSLIMLRKIVGEQYNAALLNAGLVLFFKGK